MWSSLKRALLYLLSTGILISFLVIIVFLDQYGRSSRVTGRAYSINELGVKTVSVDYPEEAYNTWKQNGLRGRVVASFSRSPAIEMPVITLMVGFPLKVFNISETVEAKLMPENFLSAAIETGIARRLIFIVPEDVFKVELNKEGVSKGNGKVDVPLFGSQRTITTMPFFKSLNEPLLLYIDASFFGRYEPEEFLRLLRNTGVETDLIVLCRAYNDDGVTDKEREKLRIFERLIGTSSERE